MKKCPKTDNGVHLPEKEVVYKLPNFTLEWSGFYVCRACGIYLGIVDNPPKKSPEKEGKI